MLTKNSMRMICLGTLIPILYLSSVNLFASMTNPVENANTLQPLTRETLARQLGWVSSPDNNCGGYYIEGPFVYPLKVENDETVAITGNYGLLSQRATSTLEGKVTVTRAGQQVTTNKAFIYRNSAGKLNMMDMIGDVHLREPYTLIIAKKGRYNFNTQSKSLMDLIYRISLEHGMQIASDKVPQEELKHSRKITLMTAWGQASEFQQNAPRIYELYQTSYSTCPPINPSWHVEASHIVLNKNTGRGYATHARLYVKNIPVLYMPYINFPIDSRRKSGFLWPTIGNSPNNWGPYFLAPFYWNIAPNYDMKITPAFLSRRGTQLSDLFRYLTPTNAGELGFSVLPGDRAFSDFKKTNVAKYSNSPIPTTQAEANRLRTDTTTRKGFFWRDDSHFNRNWSSHVDFNYASDDYYLQDFGSNLNEISQNQLLQEGDLYYKNEHWNFTGRAQAYQTLHPVTQPPVSNVYRRFPQLILNGDYPNQAFGLEYFINNEVTHFDIRNTPGIPTNLPIGNRAHIQPGVSLPLYYPYFFINPRLQLAMTQYQLSQNQETGAPNSKRRVLPIFDTVIGASFDRDISLFGQAYEQTLEPQLYYTYIPYRSQASIPIFDTVVSTLTYDQLFNYNRFNGLDRIGDANQIAMGVTTRLIDKLTGLEKMRLGVGSIVYFQNRRVTQCNNDSCTDNPNNPELRYRLSPISGTLTYQLNPSWSINAYGIWNPITKQLDNTTTGITYEPQPQHVINLSYTYAHGGDPLAGIATTDPSNNLKASTVSFAWPVISDFSAVGLWTQNWNHGHLQNLLYGLQYDTCCWAVRFVGGRAFTGLTSNNTDGTTSNNANTPQYNDEYYIQFSLKGLGDVGTGNPTQVLSSINGYNAQFGQDIR